MGTLLGISTPSPHEQPRTVRVAPPRMAERPVGQPHPSPVQASHSLSDDRVREIYRDYVNAKRQCNESTANITEASLAQRLRDSADALSQKHQGKRVDYGVVIKDGKAILKPVVRN